eukprot:CAMPEP_0198284736 /NCGR_PEP_ID=MMETSP1449-20131203/4189_1 /TAXON_ID=420275 /ORGANISM="Attheya septentrionalis, Strain CCMP2084" /LENGTH=350 /DNA_ID=CAMNT_0043981949 /DNA_START=55 /DNA_END=1107 /DNA_ORIENTATION=+
MASSGDAAGALAELMGFMNHLCIVPEDNAPILPAPTPTPAATPTVTPVVATTSEETLVAIQRYVASNHEEAQAVEQTTAAWNASQTTAMESSSSNTASTISSPQAEQSNQGMEYFHSGFQQQSPLFSSPPAKHVRFEFGKVNDTTTPTTTTAAAITPAKSDTPPGSVMAAAAAGNSNIHTPFGTFRQKQSGVSNKNNKACMVTPEGSRKRKPAPSPHVTSLPSRPSPASASSRRTASNRSGIQAPSVRPRTIRTNPSVSNHSHVKKTPSPRRVRSRCTPSSSKSKSSSNDLPQQRRPKESIPSVFDRLYRKETKSSASKRRRKDYHSFERIHHDVSSSQNDCPSNPQEVR